MARTPETSGFLITYIISIYSSAAYNTSFPMMRMDNVCALYRLEHTCTEYYLNPLFIFKLF